LPMLTDFTAMSDSREQNLLSYLMEPRSFADIGEHLFIYLSRTVGVFVDTVERRSMGMHLARLIRDQRVKQVRDQYQAVPR